MAFDPLGIISFFQGLWIIITLAWVVGGGILAYTIFDALKFMVSKKLTFEWALIPTIWVMVWIYNSVAFLTLASVGLVIVLVAFGVISLPASIMLFNFIKINFKKKKISFED